MEQRSCGCPQLWHSAPPGMAVGWLWATAEINTSVPAGLQVQLAPNGGLPIRIWPGVTQTSRSRVNAFQYYSLSNLLLLLLLLSSFSNLALFQYFSFSNLLLFHHYSFSNFLLHHCYFILHCLQIIECLSLLLLRRRSSCSRGPRALRSCMAPSMV